MNYSNFIFYAFCAACLEMAFQEYQEKNMIFDWYRKWLIKISKGDKPKLIKKTVLVLGLCPFCNGFWVAIMVYLINIPFHSLNLILFTGLNYIFIVLLIKLINHEH